ncbi:MAG: nitroreductase family protein [Alphaproteobacteria bacterium]|nr:nitroreductase family protein [Alphaproteobacteria bacterium]
MTDKTIADLIEDRFGLPTEDGKDMPAEGELAAILRHRSHRQFTDTPVPDELVRIALAAAFSAPAKSDLQQASVIVVEDPAARAALNEQINDPWVTAAPKLLVFCGDSRRLRRISEARGKPFPNDHLDAFLNCAVDAGIVLATFIRAAEALGLGCCPISVIRNKIEHASDVLGLPDHVFPLAGMGLGWPARDGWISLRLPPSVTVHTDRYDDSALLPEIDAYDRRRDARFSIPAEKQRLTEVYGVADFYGWSEDKARQYAVPQRKQLAAFLKSKRFNLD